MTHIPAIDSTTPCTQQPVYNAVKIKINNPQTNIPEGLKEGVKNGTYNAVNVEVNNPSVNLRKAPIYNYPVSNELVTYDRTGLVPIYNLINNRTFINAEIDVKQDCHKAKKPVNVPAPNITTPEAEKKTPNEVIIHELSFKAAPNVKIVPSEEIKPEVNIDKVLADLASNDYDVQALQMEKIVKISMKDTKMAQLYINADIFSSLMDIVQKDTSDLAGPSAEQIDIRKKIIFNELVKEEAKKQGQEIKKEDLPFKISDDELKTASKLSQLELAERNKEYGLYTLSSLAKIYGDEYEKKVGTVVPLTDLPGASVFADALKKSNNPGVRIAAIDALMYIRRPEYNRDIKAIMQVATHDKNPSVSEMAKEAVDLLEILQK